MRPKLRKFICAIIITFGLFLLYSHKHLSLSSIKWKLNSRYVHRQPSPGNNIFFTETDSFIRNVVLDPRLACGIESAAKMNPNSQVFLVYSSHMRFENLKLTPELEAIVSYPNVHIVHFDIDQLAIGSPLEDFVKSKKLGLSRFKIKHTSDVLRLLLLWKFSGTYLEDDILVRKPLDSVPSNYVCAQTSTTVTDAVLNLDTKVGSLIVDTLMSELAEHADGWNSDSYGPMIVTKALQKICETDNVAEIVKKKNCNGFNIMDSSQCYKIPYGEWFKFAEEEHAAETMSRIEESLVVDVWKGLWHNKQLDVSSSAAYIQLAKQFCPKVVSSCGKTL